MEVTTRIAPLTSAAGTSSASPQAIPSGQAVAARVQQIVADGVFRLVTAAGPIDVRSPTPLPVGSPVTLFIAPGTGEVRVILSNSQGLPGQAAAQPAPSVQPATPAATTERSDSPPVGARPLLATASNADGAARQGPPLAAGTTGGTAAAQIGALSAAPQANASNGKLPAAMMAPGGPMFAMIAAALTRQDSLAPLLANLAVLTDRRRDLPVETSRAGVLPENVRVAAARVAEFILPAETALTPESIQRAIENSGTLFEKALASANATRPQAPDLKGALLLLRDALQSMTSVEGATSTSKAPPEVLAKPSPPRRGSIPEPQKAAMSLPLPSGAPLDVARSLLDQTEAALARLRLVQVASIAGERDPSAAGLDTAPQQLHVEIPFAIGRDVVAMPIVIERDAEAESAETDAPTWRVWFAIDVEPAGPITGLVTLGGREGSVGVTLWAERDATQRVLQDSLPGLRRALEAEDLAVADLGARAGSPRRTSRPAGRFLDTRT